MRIIHTVGEWQELRKAVFGKTFGFVPTMGALHPGHISLVERSRQVNDRTAVSIFVNPTQFNDPNDFQKYPKTWDADVQALEKSGADYLFAPEISEMYPDHSRYLVDENEFSKELCGAYREGHFRGVLTVVMKLLNLMDADRAYFGEKDFQQLELIEGMTRSFFMKTQIIACPTVREADGLAMSSRNMRLSPQDREKAPFFHKVLRKSVSVEDRKKRLISEGFEVEYLEELDFRGVKRIFGAVWLGGVRLIDNVEL